MEHTTHQHIMISLSVWMLECLDQNAAIMYREFDIQILDERGSIVHSSLSLTARSLL